MKRLAFSSLRAAYAAGSISPTQLVSAVLERMAAVNDDAIWIARSESAQLFRRAAYLEGLTSAQRAHLPLFGLPYAVKDNIDVAQMPTTAGCPAYAYTPQRSASVVQRLDDAGAICIGKTNLDQFATGLVGTRSAFGTPRNPFDESAIPGGSSSGSAVALARGLVSFALGTDTAGSGRIPAGFNDLVGLKPTRGLLSTSGVVPACRSLDCVSILAVSVADAIEIFEVAVAFDSDDSFSRTFPRNTGAALAPIQRVAVPLADELEFFGDAESAVLFEQSVERMRGLGVNVAECSIRPALNAGRLLYEGAFVAERTAAVGDFISANPNAVLEVTRTIIEAGRRFSAVDAFRDLERLQDLRSRAAALWQHADALLVPTAPRCYSVAEVLAEPYALNANLGYYTNFVNLLDLCALAVPAGFNPAGFPFGITFIAPPFADRALAQLGARFTAERDRARAERSDLAPDPAARCALD